MTHFQGVLGYPEVGFPQRVADNLACWVESRDERLITPHLG